MALWGSVKTLLLAEAFGPFQLPFAWWLLPRLPEYAVQQFSLAVWLSDACSETKPFIRSKEIVNTPARSEGLSRGLGQVLNECFDLASDSR